MTSREIEDIDIMLLPNGFNHHVANLLKEIAYQLAVMNERSNVAPRDELRIHPDYGGTLGSPAVEGQDAKRAATEEGIEGFEPPIPGEWSIHTYRQAHPDSRFCCKCGAGEFHLIHDIPEHFRNVKRSQDYGPPTKNDLEKVQPQWSEKGPIKGE